MQSKSDSYGSLFRSVVPARMMNRCFLASDSVNPRMNGPMPTALPFQISIAAMSGLLFQQFANTGVLPRHRLARTLEEGVAAELLERLPVSLCAEAPLTNASLLVPWLIRSAVVKSLVM